MQAQETQAQETRAQETQAQDTQTDEAFSPAQWQAKALDCERRIYQGLPLVDEALLLMEKAECYLHLQAPEMAARSLDRIALYALNDSLRTEIFALRALCEKAVLPQIEATDSQNSKNPETARWLSLIPGLGHFYAGAVGEGFFSMALNAASIAFVAMELSSGLYVGAFLGGGILLSQTYLGATERAIQLASE